MRTWLTSSSAVDSTEGGHRADGGEVEPEPARRVLRARLRGRLTERAAEGAVHQVRRGVRAGDGAPPLHVDLGVHGRADDDLAGRHGAAVHDQARDRRLHVGDLDPRLVAGAAAEGDDDAVVGKLAAALGVERRAVQDDLDRGARACADGTATPPTSRPTTVASVATSSYPVKVTRPACSSTCANTEMSALPVFLPAASALARCRCSVISRRNSPSSTARPCSLAISSVRSIGKP